jgi:hypothetical protein
VVVRLLLLRWPRLWHDEATTGLLGLAVLQGDLPIYFFGQPFMGALDGYLAAPIYWSLGISARTLELVPVLLALITVALTVRLASDGFGPCAALLTAVLLALPPDFLLYWSHEARNHYPLTLVLGTLALLLALRVPVAGGRRRVLLSVLLGGTLGLAFWTNFLSLIYWPAVATLLLRRGVRPLVPSLLAALPAFALGSLPHWLYGVPHGTALPPPGRPIGIAAVLAHVGLFAETGWPIVAGVPAALRGSSTGAVLAGLVGGLYLVAAGAALGGVRLAASKSRWTGRALVVLAVTTVGVAAGTEYGRRLGDYDPHYLLPLYTALPPLLGRFLAGLPRCGMLAGTAAILALHVAGALGGSFRNLRPEVAAAERAEFIGHQEAVRAFEQANLHRLYDREFPSRKITFLSAGRVIFSNPYEEIRPSFARAVDGAAETAWWTGKRSPALEGTLAALGIQFAYERLPGIGGVYRGFALAAPSIRELGPATLRISASTGPAAHASDRVGGTIWSTGRAQRGGERLEIDLGRVQPVALIRWLPGTFQETPRGLRLEASSDGATWRTLLDVPQYIGPLYWSAERPMGRVRSGRVELRVPSVPARHLRLTQTGADETWAWTIRELYVYAATGAAPAPSLDADGGALADAVRRSGVRRLYADHGWASRVALADPSIHVPPANLQLDDYGWKGPGAMLFPPFRWTPGTGALLEPVDAEGFEATARAGGLAFESRRLGGLTLFVHAPPRDGGRALPASALTVTGSRDPRSAAQAVDGDPATRWTTAGPRAAGDWFRIDLPARPVVRGLSMSTENPADLPLAMALESSSDGAHWQPLTATLRLERRYRWGGFGLLDDGPAAARLDFPPVAVGALRIVLRDGDPTFDWSIHELAVYGGD